MGQIIKLDYNGELGYSETISNVVQFVFRIYEITVDEFLDFEVNGLTNRQIVFSHYSINEKISLGLSDETGKEIKNYKSVTTQMRCPLCSFNIDSGYILINEVINSSNLLVDDFSVKDISKNGKGADGKVFEINKFFKDYISTIRGMYKATNFEDKENIRSRKQFLHPRVWIWSKSLNENGVFNTHSIFDLSPFVETINTSVIDTGGNFNISLINIEGVISMQNGQAVGCWSVDKKRYIKFKNNGKFNYAFKNVLNGRFNQKDVSPVYSDEVILGQEELFEILIDRDTKNSSTDMFFKNLISSNDVIFISFNDFDQDSIEKCDDFFIGNDKLPNCNWDMIGLIDTNSVSTTYEGDSVGANISGRDCMKLLIEDGSNFFADSYSNNGTSVFENILIPNRGDRVNSLNNFEDPKKGQDAANRLLSTGLIDCLYNHSSRNIQFVMNLLISRLSNVSICNSRLFEYYGDKITKFKVAKFELVKKDKKKK